MKINDVLLSNVTPIGMQVLLDDNTTVDIVSNNSGEALIRFGDQAVERYTALANTENFDLNEFWGLMFTFSPRLLMLPNHSKFTGFDPIPWQVLATVSTVANFEGNPTSKIIQLNHEYATKTAMPSLKKDIHVAYKREEQESPSHLYYFADLMDWLSTLGDAYNVQFMVGQSPNGVTITAKYKGVRDNRHLRVNELFDSLLGKRNGKAEEA